MYMLISVEAYITQLGNCMQRGGRHSAGERRASVQNRAHWLHGARPGVLDARIGAGGRARAQHSCKSASSVQCKVQKLKCAVKFPDHSAQTPSGRH